MQSELSHERLDIYKVYLDAANLCGDIVSGAAAPIVAHDNVQRVVSIVTRNRRRGRPPKWTAKWESMQR